MESPGFTVWLTGITGSGKSTLASNLNAQLEARGVHCEVLDSGRIRQALNRSLGFSRDEIEQALLRLGYECKLLNRNGIVAIVAAVSPYRDVRDRIRSEVERFVEVFVACPMEVLMQRDSKDLLSRAQRGEVQHVAGVNAPYEPPEAPEILCNTESTSAEDCVARILEKLESLEYLAPASTGYAADEEEIIKQRMRDLGYI